MTLYLHRKPSGRFDLIAKRADGSRHVLCNCRGRRSAYRALRHAYIELVVRPEIVLISLLDSDGAELWKTAN